MAYLYSVLTECVTIFSTGSEFQPVSDLNAITLAACSYALLLKVKIILYKL